MNNQTENKRDDLYDWLMDLALREKLAGQRPPDLSKKILRRAEGRSEWNVRKIARYAAAACVLLGMSLAAVGYWTGREPLQLARMKQSERVADEARSGPKMYLSTTDSSESRGEADLAVPNLELKPAQTGALHVWIKPGDEATVASPAKDATVDPLVPPPSTLKPSDIFKAKSFEGDSDFESRRPHEGTGPGFSGNKYAKITDNPFKRVGEEPLSTFSIDVDRASYSMTRTFVMDHGRLPPVDAVRIEEFINYFPYDYTPPRTGEPFAVHLETAACPWAGSHRLVRVGLKGKVIEHTERPAGNYVFLVDVSGSMEPANKLPLVREGMKLLVDQLDRRDRVAIVVYAGDAGLVLDSTVASERDVIKSRIDSLRPMDSTYGEKGIRLAYQIAQDHFIKDGVNRIVLCTDGDFNVGVTSTAELVGLVEERAKTTGVFLTVLGFGMGNHRDELLESLADKGNGIYGYIDRENEARKMFVEELTGTLITIAKDVKIQVEFNPVQVAAYRLIGYENRVLAKEDFNDDKKDAGEIGAGHTVTALYEILPAGKGDDAKAASAPKVDDLEFQKPGDVTDAARESGQMLVVKLRYKEPDGDTSKLIKVGVKDDGNDFSRATLDFKFATAVASFGMLLRDSPHKGSATFDSVLEIARSALGKDQHGYRAELVRLVEQAKSLGR